MLPVLQPGIKASIFTAQLECFDALPVCFHRIDSAGHFLLIFFWWRHHTIVTLFFTLIVPSAPHSLATDCLVMNLQHLNLDYVCICMCLCPCVRWRGRGVLAPESFISQWVCGSTHPGNTSPSSAAAGRARSL